MSRTEEPTDFMQPDEDSENKLLEPNSHSSEEEKADCDSGFDDESDINENSDELDSSDDPDQPEDSAAKQMTDTDILKLVERTERQLKREARAGRDEPQSVDYYFFPSVLKPGPYLLVMRSIKIVIYELCACRQTLCCRRPKRYYKRAYYKRHVKNHFDYTYACFRSEKRVYSFC